MVRARPCVWEVVPQSQDAAGDTAPAGSDFLEQDLVRRLAAGPLRWQLNMTLANPGDPLDDASKTWTGAHKVLNAGTLVLQSSQPQADGDCRDINFDPLILPSGIQASNDPLLAARSAAYASSYLRRAGEVKPVAQRPSGVEAMNAQPRFFAPLARVLHWLMALMIIAMLFIGAGLAASVSERHEWLIHLHKPLGIAILALVIVRLAVRF